MPVATRHLRCSSEELRLLSPVADLDDLRRHALTRWLREHDMTTAMVSVGLPVRRNAHHRTVEWHEPAADHAVVRRSRTRPTTDATWPRPFPPILLDR